MPADAAALARVLHSSSASLDEKLDAARALCDVVFAQGHQDAPLPELLRAHYAASLLDWLLSAIGRSGAAAAAAGSGKQRQKKKGKAAEDGAAATISAPRTELWTALITALQHPIVSPDRPLPASLLPAATAALHPDAAPADLDAVYQLLRLLAIKFSGSFKPALDPTAAAVAAALAVRGRSPPAAAAALDLMLPLVQHHPNPRKAWDAVVPRLVGPLVGAAFSGGGGDANVAGACQAVLAAAAFSPAHVAALAEAATPGGDDQAPRSYAAQLFAEAEQVVAAAVTGGDPAVRALDALPWAVAQYCSAFAQHKRAAEIAAAIAKPTFGAGSGGREQDKPAEARTVGGVPIDADFRFFSAIAAILERRLSGDGAAGPSAPALLRCLAGVCAALKSHHIYRPTEDPSGAHRERLAGVVACAARLGAAAPTAPAVADAALRVLQAVLEVEHRGVQAHLPSLWPMLWAPGAAGAAAAQPAVAAALVQAYAELRQLEVLLSSLSDAIAALGDAPAAAAAAELLASAAFRGALTAAVRAAPSGQAAPLVRAVAAWPPRLVTAKAPLVLADLGACVLGAVAADVTTAPAVAGAAAELVAVLAALLVPELRKLLGAKKNGAPERAAGWLALYRLALRLAARCSLLHPEVLSLPGQEVQPLEHGGSGPAGGYFDALEGGKGLDAAAAWRLGGGEGFCPPALQAALLAAAAQRLETLGYRRLHALHACGGAADENEEEGGMGAAWRRRRDAAPAIEAEMASIGSLLAGRAAEGAQLGSCDALSLATAAAVPDAARSLALSCASLAGVADVLTQEALHQVVSAALDEAMEAGSGGGGARGDAASAALASPAAAAALPLVAATRAHALLRDLVVELPSGGERKRKKSKTPEGNAKSGSGPLDALIKCVKHAAKGSSSGGELAQALAAAAEGLEASGSRGGAAAAPTKPGKRKSERPDASGAGILVLNDVTRLLSSLLRLELRPLQPVGAMALAATGLAAAAAAVASGAGVGASETVCQALRIVAAAAPLPVEACVGMPQFLAALSAAGDAAGVPLSAASLRKAAQQATEAALRAAGDDSRPGAAVSAWLSGAFAAPLPASRLVVIEGVLAAAREVVSPVSAAPADDDEAAAGSACADAEAVSLAATLFSTFEAQSPALASLSGTAALAPAAACAAHALAVRCWAPANAQGALSEPCPLLQRLPDDVSTVAAALAALPFAEFSGAAAATAADLLRYLESACAVTCAMKPTAPLEHYTSMLCLLLHVLRLLPAPAAAVDPLRRTTPLAAAFPAARTAPGGASAAREVALNALRALLAGSPSHRLRQVLAFAEAAAAGGGSAAVGLHYRLPVAELALMALEGCRGQAAMRTLGQHAERLAAALTAAITRAACPLTVASVGGSGSATFTDLYDAFCAAGEGEETAAAPTAAWAAVPLPPPVESDAAVAVATALRAVESIAARPKALPLSGRHVARALHAVTAAATAPGVCGAGSPAAAAAFVNACHLLMAVARHREGELGRCMPLATNGLRALLTALVRWEAAAAPGEGPAHRVYCAQALAAAMAELAGVKASEKYCPHVLADYLILAGCPATPASLAALGLGGGGERAARLLCGPGVAAALRQGAYAVYGACGTAGVQYVYASLGSRGGGGLWRAGLAALKADHDKNFKYTGKV